MTFDPFALEEGGGGIDAFTGTITQAFWQPGEYGTSLCIVSMFDHPELFPAKEDGTYTGFYPAGKGWNTEDGGESVVHETGDDGKNFRKDSGVGRLVAALGAIPGVRDLLPSDFDSRKASSYKGLHLEWGRVPVTKRKPKVDADGNRVLDASGKEVWGEVEETQLLPVGIVGAASSNGAGTLNVDDLGLDMETLTALATMAQSTDSATFMVQVATKYQSNTALMTAVTKDAEGTRKALAEAVI